MLEVTPIANEVFRFLVKSQEKPGQEYLVDLQENSMEGQCGCAHFAFRLQPRINAGEKGMAVRCKHIRMARERWFDYFGSMVAEMMEKP